MIVGYTFMFLAIIGTVAGQLFIKAASNNLPSFHSRDLIRNKFIYFSFICIAIVPILTNIALDYFQLSVLFAFTGLNYVFTTLGARLFLNEKVTTRMMIGIVFIALGILLFQY